MKIIENNSRVSELDQSRASGTRTSPTTSPASRKDALRAARRDRGLSGGGRGSREEARLLGKRGLAAYVERAACCGAAERESRGSGSRFRRRKEERRRSGESERASESIVVADPAGTLTPCSQSPPPPLLYIFPGSCPCSRTFDYASYLSPLSPASSAFARRDRVSRVPEESPVPLSSPAVFLRVFPHRLFQWVILLSVLPPPPIAVTPVRRAVCPRDFAHSFFRPYVSSFSSDGEKE